MYTHVYTGTRAFSSFVKPTKTHTHTQTPSTQKYTHMYQGQRHSRLSSNPQIHADTITHTDTTHELHTHMNERRRAFPPFVNPTNTHAHAVSLSRTHTPDHTNTLSHTLSLTHAYDPTNTSETHEIPVFDHVRASAHIHTRTHTHTHTQIWRHL